MKQFNIISINQLKARQFNIDEKDVIGKKCFTVFEPKREEHEEFGKQCKNCPAFEAFEKGGGAGNGLEGRVVVTWSGFGRQADTQVSPRPRARDSAAGFATAYELSRGLHRKANWRAVRFGPIRISPLQ